MSQVRSLPSTLREKSTWTPKNFPPSNEKIFQERMSLIKKWYAAWNESQRWILLEYILRQQDDNKLEVIHDLLHPVLPPPDHDFTCVLPRFLCLRIFSLLDPQSLCRAAQVSWYWKYLAESNELWQRKCLRLGWFLPTPTSTYDYTVWKRHYISCVCQLHWNPPQPPPEDTNEELEETKDEVDGEADKKKTKKQKIPRQPVSDGPKKPWKDPDRHPRDIHYFHSNQWSPTSPNSRLTSPMNLLASTSTTVNTSKVGQSTSKPRVPVPTPDPPFIPPPSSLLHPTLLEKMRLGSPSLAHIQLSTLNRTQSNQSISETLYGLQNAAPFPRLPPYYVHKPANSVVNRTHSIGMESADAAGYIKAKPAATGSRPLSGSNSKTRQEQLTHTRQSPSEANKDPGKCSALLSQPWAIPQDDDEG